MKLTVLTPDKEVFLGSVKSVKVPGTDGEFQILKNHAPIVSALDEGDVYIIVGEEEFQLYNNEKKVMESISEAGRPIIFQIKGGFIEVLNNEVSLLVNGVKNIK